MPFSRESPEAFGSTPSFVWLTLAGLGIVDLVRGLMHTFLMKYASVEIAGMNLAEAGNDQLMLLGAFGISNFLTGAIFLAVAWKAKGLAPLVLAMIPLAYALGILAFKLNHLSPEAAFPGRYFMLAYLAVCVVTFAASLICRRQKMCCTT